MNVLVVDDHATNRRLLRAVLEAENHAVVEAGDGIEALERLRQDPIGAVISDILMPRMDGYRLCAEVRRSAAWSALPFLFYTATYNAVSDEKLARELGADGFLHKPAPAREIAAALQAAQKVTRRPAAQTLEDAAGLKEYSERLIHKLEAKNLELEQVNADLAESSGRLRALAARLQSVREQERTSIAREIHDVLAQELTRLKIDLVWIARRLSPPPSEAGLAAISEKVVDAIALADTSISTVQRIATELRPVILDTLGLPAAIEWLASDFARRTGIDCRAVVPTSDGTLERDRATAVFRILQESLTNVARHAQARNVRIRLTQVPGAIELAVVDDGVGINPGIVGNPLSIGLMGMRERAEAFGGSFSVARAPGAGSVVSVRIPS